MACLDPGRSRRCQQYSLQNSEDDPPTRFHLVQSPQCSESLTLYLSVSIYSVGGLSSAPFYCTLLTKWDYLSEQVWYKNYTLKIQRVVDLCFLNHPEPTALDRFKDSWMKVRILWEFFFKIGYSCFANCVSCCCTMKWISYAYTYNPSLLSLPPTHHTPI